MKTISIENDIETWDCGCTYDRKTMKLNYCEPHEADVAKQWFEDFLGE